MYLAIQALNVPYKSYGITNYYVTMEPDGAASTGELLDLLLAQ